MLKNVRKSLKKGFENQTVIVKGLCTTFRIRKEIQKLYLRVLKNRQLHLK
jgi:hypothetical protein